MTCYAAQAIADIATSAGVLFDYLDDQASLGSHMQNPSMMMLGGRMSYEFDEAKGRAVGSVIKMRDILGLVLSVEKRSSSGNHPDARFGRRVDARTQ